MIDLNNLNNEIKQLVANSKTDELVEKSKAAAASMAAKTKAVFKDAGEIKNGIKCTVQTKDAQYDDYDADVAAEDCICEVAGPVPGLEAEMQGSPTTAEQSSIDSITGKYDREKDIQLVMASNPGMTYSEAAAQCDRNASFNAKLTGIAPGNLKKIITAGSPEAIAQSLSAATGKKPSEFKGALADISTPDAQEAIDNIEAAIDKGVAAASEVAKAVGNVFNNLANALEDNVGDLFGNLSIKMDKSIVQTLSSAVDNFVKPDLDFGIKDMLKDLSNQNYDGLVSKIGSVKGVVFPEVEAAVRSLSLVPAKTITSEKSPAVGTKSIPCYQVGSNDNTWQGADTPTTGAPTTINQQTDDQRARSPNKASGDAKTQVASIKAQIAAANDKILSNTGDIATLQTDYDERRKEFIRQYGEENYLDHYDADAERTALNTAISQKEDDNSKLRKQISDLQYQLDKLPKAQPKPVQSKPTSSQFSYVNSKEELQAEFASCTRPITEVVVHWTATYTNQDIGSEDVHQWHKQRGWSGIGYHFIIRRDGRLQRGRPVSQQGAHAGAGNHNKYSIGISLAGGYNCPSGTKNPNKYISADSLTPEQMKTLDMFLSAFYDEWPGGQAFGHVDTDNKGKLDPGFDVGAYVFSKFGKKNVTNGKQPPVSPQQLAKARSVTEQA